MADAHFITEQQAQAAITHPSYAVKPTGAGTINYVADWIAEVLDDLVGQIDQNITVETSIDPKLQSIAEASVIDELAAKSVKFNVTQGALVAMTPTGEVRAMVGGRNYADSQFNRAVTAKRQPGSAFKPFVYLTAIEAGLTPDTIRQDAPIDVKGWKPENYSHEYFGSVTLTQALAMSLNTVAVRLGLEVGAKNVVRTAHRLGITSKLEANASIALGTSEVSLLELAGAYAPFANGGRAVSPHVVNRIRTDGGKVLYQRPPDPLDQVIEPRNVAMMNTMLKRIGEPYLTRRRRADQTYPERKGLGLGIFIARTLLERTGATVTFTNRTFPDHGAVVRVAWPRESFETTEIIAESAP